MTGMWKAGAALVAGVALCTATAGARTRSPAPPAGSVAYDVVDADTGTVLAETEAPKRWPPASLT